MDNDQKKAMIEEIAKLVKTHDDQASIEAYTRHYFWRYYEKQRKKGLVWSLDEFWDQIPDNCRVLASKRHIEYEKRHHDLIEFLPPAKHASSPATNATPKTDKVSTIPPPPPAPVPKIDFKGTKKSKK